MNNKLTFIDLFAGAGGKSCGFEQAGYELLFATDINESCAQTFVENRKALDKNSFIIRDIRLLPAEEILDIIKLRPKQLDVICGGPPCQGFSLAGRRDPNDKRNTLFEEYVKIVKGILPKWFIMENVVGILSMKVRGKNVKDLIIESFAPEYNVDLAVLNAVKFGVPQTRERVFFVGNRLGKQNPFPTGQLSRKEYVTVEQAIGDLEDINIGESCKVYKCSANSEYQKRIRKGAKKGEPLFNHEAANHSKVVTKRFSMLKPGGDMNSLPPNYRTKKRNLYRLKHNEPSKTVVTLPDDIVHYNKPRILTVRETARLQSFDDDYFFCGKRTTGGLKRREECPQYTQVGNAVPPLLAKAVALELIKHF